MNYLNFEASQHEMKLIQMGAKVEQINSKMCYIKFVIEGIPVEYVYNLNKKNKYFLERIKPYPLAIRSYENVEDLVKVIDVDIKQFRNLVKSKNVKSFVNITKELIEIIKRFEDLILYYNVPADEVEVIMNKVNEIHEEITKTKETSDRVFHDKDPENL
ncbi:MAG: hypothetical protein K0R80_362 [Clostridia bacterium]|jgi:hypothetical protein|nr:hypothetical protein [Clostridia bacterium]MDF2889995.1 hypothetical protein [Clostridia bacterium]